MYHAELPEHIRGVWGSGGAIGLKEMYSHQVMIPMPKVMKKPATQPSTLHDQDKARIAKQTYSVNRSKVVFCQLNVRNLI
jgi:hypothetical protein